MSRYLRCSERVHRDQTGCPHPSYQERATCCAATGVRLLYPVVEGATMSPSPTTATSTPAPVSWVRGLEGATALDPLVRAVRPLADALVADPARRDLLRGAWLGHAVHPLLTDAPIGFWTSALVLDLVGGSDARPAAQRLVALGLLTAGPTAVTGWAEWSGSGQREKRVGVVHAVANVTAVALFASSWRARSRGRHAQGVALGLAASSALSLGGFLGGHLVAARKVGSRHPEFEESGPRDSGVSDPSLHAV
jgi:uncharacterized membrane protein